MNSPSTVNSPPTLAERLATIGDTLEGEFMFTYLAINRLALADLRQLTAEIRALEKRAHRRMWGADISVEEGSMQAHTDAELGVTTP